MNVSGFVRFLVAIISSITFVVISSLLLMNESFGFLFYFIGILAIGAPAIFVIGIPCSYLIDAILYRLDFSRKAINVLVQMLLYMVCGFIGTLISIALFGILSVGSLNPQIFGGQYLPFTLFGVAAALIYFIFLQLASLLLSSNNNSIK